MSLGELTAFLDWSADSIEWSDFLSAAALPESLEIESTRNGSGGMDDAAVSELQPIIDHSGSGK